MDDKETVAELFYIPDDIHERLVEAPLGRIAGMPAYRASVVGYNEQMIFARPRSGSDVEDIASYMRSLDPSDRRSSHDIAVSTVYRVIPLGLAGIVTMLAGHGAAPIACSVTDGFWVDFFAGESLLEPLLAVAAQLGLRLERGRNAALRLASDRLEPMIAAGELLGEEASGGVFPIS